MLTVESKVHFILFSLVFPSFLPCPFKFLFVWLRPLDEFSGTRYPGLTADRYDILVLEMYVMYLVLSRALFCIAYALLFTNYVVRMFLLSSAHAMEIQQEINGN